MPVLLLLLALAGPARAAQCPRAPFIAGGGDAFVPPIASLFLFWPHQKQLRRPELTVETLAGVSKTFTAVAVSRDPAWDVYALTVVAGPKDTYRVSAVLGKESVKETYSVDPHWKKPSFPAAYRLGEELVRPPRSKCFPWPKGAKATPLFADGS